MAGRRRVHQVLPVTPLRFFASTSSTGLGVVEAVGIVPAWAIAVQALAVHEQYDV